MDKDKIKIWFDEDVDVLYVSLKKGASVHSEEKEDGVRLEYDEKGEIVGLEITEITKRLAKPIARRLAEAVKQYPSADGLIKRL
ncbi:MAG: DUF2283 domain-containing protein [bacterium]|nr:DUF2283 domain-containing protein [bacterium]